VLIMEKLVKELDHLCSIPEYSFYDGAFVLRDECHGFSYPIEIVKASENEVVARLPFLKYRNVDPKMIFGELKSEIAKNFPADPTNIDYSNPRKLSHMHLRMPHHNEQKCYENMGYFCSLKTGGDKLVVSIDQIDVDLYTDLPYNMFYSFLFATLMAHLGKMKLAGCVLDFQSCYLRKEDLPKVGKILGEEILLDECRIVIKKPFSRLDDASLANLEIVIS